MGRKKWKRRLKGMRRRPCRSIEYNINNCFFLETTGINQKIAQG